MKMSIIDEQIKKLSEMQVELLKSEGIDPEDFNRISEMIGNLKEYMINCNSYFLKK